MFELDDVQKYIQNKFMGLYDNERVSYLHEMITNPCLQLQGTYDPYISYKHEASEDTTIAHSIKTILAINDIDWLLGEEKRVTQAINETAEAFSLFGISRQARIPFYILTLNKLVDI